MHLMALIIYLNLFDDSQVTFLVSFLIFYIIFKLGLIGQIKDNYELYIILLPLEGVDH